MESISDLPNHLVALIVQHLTIEERCRCCIVNKMFNSLNSQQQLGPELRVRPKQVADTNFLTWAKGRLSGVTVLLIYPCQSIGDRVAQHDLTAGLVLLMSMCHGLKALHVPDAISLSQTVLRHLPCSLKFASLSVTFDDACMEARRGETYTFPPSMPSLRELHLQITCVNVRSYGLVTMPLLLPASLESLWVGTKARGRRLGPSLLMPKASELPSVKEIELDATCFICHEGDSSLAAFLNALPKLEGVKLRSDVRAVDYHSALTHLSGVKRKQWEAL